jgi:predicted transcriptional regulator
MERATADLVQVATRVDEETLRRLDALCESEKRSRSFVLLEALELRLDRDSETQGAKV